MAVSWVFMFHKHILFRNALELTMNLFENSMGQGENAD